MTKTMETRWMFSISDKDLILKRIDEIERILDRINDENPQKSSNLNASISKCLGELKNVRETIQINFSTLYDLLEAIQKRIYYDVSVGRAGNVLVVEMDMEDDEE